jgi:hypothetical protein
MTISDSDKQNPLISKFNPPVSKKCRICLFSEFEVDESTKDRHNVICKDCKAEESWGGCCRDHFEEMVITCTHAQLSLNLRVIEALEQHEAQIPDELLQKMYRIVCRSGLRFYCDNCNARRKDNHNN